MTKKTVNLNLMGLDLGDATIGISFSDDLGLTAQSYQTYKRVSKKKDVDYIVDLACEKNITKIILGLPLLMNGDLSEQAQKTLDFKKALEKKLKYSSKLDYDIVIDMQDERLTSKFAETIMREGELTRKQRAQNVDKIAASLILQTYMDIKGR